MLWGGEVCAALQLEPLAASAKQVAVVCLIACVSSSTGLRLHPLRAPRLGARRPWPCAQRVAVPGHARSALLFMAMPMVVGAWLVRVASYWSWRMLFRNKQQRLHLFVTVDRLAAC
jgi:hypothetical protein